MAITDRAGLVSAAKARFQFFGSNTVGSTPLLFPSSGSGGCWETSYDTSTNAYAKPAPAVRGAGGTLFTNGSVGFLNFASPSGGQKAYIESIAQRFSVAGQASFGFTLLWLDVVWGCSGFSMNTTSAQNVSSFPALSRPDANGTGLLLFANSASAGGGVVSDVSVSYTNQAGVSGRTATIGNVSTWAQSMNSSIITRQSGDTGIKSIQSLTMGTATGAVGDMHLYLAKLVAVTSVPRMFFQSRKVGWSKFGLPELPSNAALLPVLFSPTNTPFRGLMTLAYG